MSTMPEYQSDFARKYVAQGREEGRVEGRVEGRREALCAAIRRVIGGRGLVLTEEQSARLEACADLAQLDAWLDRAVVAHDASEVFAAT